MHSPWLHIDQVSAGRQCDKKNAASAGEGKTVFCSRVLIFHGFCDSMIYSLPELYDVWVWLTPGIYNGRIVDFYILVHLIILHKISFCIVHCRMFIALRHERRFTLRFFNIGCKQCIESGFTKTLLHGSDAKELLSIWIKSCSDLWLRKLSVTAGRRKDYGSQN